LPVCQTTVVQKSIWSIPIERPRMEPDDVVVIRLKYMICAGLGTFKGLTF